MKQTSIDKISKVYVALQGSEYAGLAELLQDVIRAEAITPAKAGKFNIYNYVADDEIRPAMNGVFLNDGWKTASDSHILISIKEEYDKEFEGRVMYKDGSFYNIHRRVKDENGEWVEKDQFTAYKDDEGHERTIYPKWESVIPNVSAGGYRPYKFDREKFYSWVDEKRTEHKAETGKGIKWSPNWLCKVGPCGFKAEWFARFIEAMDALGTDEVYLHEDGRHAALVQSDKGKCVLMPVLIEDRYESVTL